MHKKLLFLAVVGTISLFGGLIYGNQQLTTHMGYSYTIIPSPVLSDPNPANESEGQSLNPTLSITVNGTSLMDVTFRTNATGLWGDIGSNDSVGNGTYYQATSNMGNYETIYYWSVNCTYTNNEIWTNETYSFKTKK